MSHEKHNYTTAT